MIEALAIVSISLAILVYGVVSGRLERTVVTAPMVFVFFGLVIGERGLGLVEFEMDKSIIHGLAEITLLAVLFLDASRIDIGRLRREHDLPVRLLLIGLPLTIVCGALVGKLVFPGLLFWDAAVMAAILAPTDAALGRAVVENERVPARIRQALNVESGLNDGIALPFVLILISVAGGEEHGGTAAFWARFAILQVTLGPIVGIGVGYVGGKLIELGMRSKWMNHSFQDLCALSLAFLAFGAAELIGGNGFIASFCAGLTVGNYAKNVLPRLHEFAEAEGELLSLAIFMIFGAVMLPVAIDHFRWSFIFYAVLSLTAIRMIPVAIALLGKGLTASTTLFLGWFGPRGLASILFVLVVLEEAELKDGSLLVALVVTTVGLSVLCHGLTSTPIAGAYGDRMEAMGRAAGMSEHRPTSEMPGLGPSRRRHTGIDDKKRG